MESITVQSDYSMQTVQDAIGRAAFNLRKHAMSDYDRESAKILEELVFQQSTTKEQSDASTTA